MQKSEQVDLYLADFDENVRSRMEQIRQEIELLVPAAEEKISYGIAAYMYRKKPLVYYAGYKNHVGFYATPNGHEEFAKEFSSYKQGKGSVQFPNNQEFPLELIRRVILFRKKTIEEKEK